MSRRSIAVTMLILALAAVAMAADDLFIGTWKLNVAKTKALGKTTPTFKSDLVTIEAQENGLKFTFDRVDANGKAIHFTNAAKFDGKDYPAAASSGVETISLKRVGSNSFEQVAKAKGEVSGRYRIVISKDGKTSTVTAEERDSKGQKATWVYIYDRQ